MKASGIRGSRWAVYPEAFSIQRRARPLRVVRLRTSGRQCFFSGHRRLIVQPRGRIRSSGTAGMRGACQGLSDQALPPLLLLRVFLFCLVSWFRPKKIPCRQHPVELTIWPTLAGEL